MNFEVLTHAASLNLIRATWNHPRTKSCYRKDAFYLNKQPFIHILFLQTSQHPWNTTKDATGTLPAEYEQRHLCQTESRAFHTDSHNLELKIVAAAATIATISFFQTTGQCLQGQSKGEQLPPRLHHNYRCTTVENAAGGLLGTQKLRLHATAFGGWDWGGPDNPSRQTLQIKADLLHVILFSLSKDLS